MISKYVQQAIDTWGQIERADLVEYAQNDYASEDVLDALDAVGSRVFRTQEDVKKFLTDQGYIS
jgi:hypothetical protein